MHSDKVLEFSTEAGRRVILVIDARLIQSSIATYYLRLPEPQAEGLE
jgi:hypothetical protein